jgi:hypothetical protein
MALIALDLESNLTLGPFHLLPGQPHSIGEAHPCEQRKQNYRVIIGRQFLEQALLFFRAQHALMLTRFQERYPSS